VDNTQHLEHEESKLGEGIEDQPNTATVKQTRSRIGKKNKIGPQSRKQSLVTQDLHKVEPEEQTLKYVEESVQ